MTRINTWSRSRKLRFAATTIVAAITLTIIAAVVPNVVTAEATATAPAFRNQLVGDAAASKLVAPTSEPLALSFTARARTATTIQPVVTASTARRTASATSVSSGSTSSAPVASGDELAQAQSILASYIAKYPILSGTTVSIGDANGYQAIAYYKSGRIVISPTHTASLSRIIGHEIWHIIDWRDNGVIDWGENIPPN